MNSIDITGPPDSLGGLMLIEGLDLLFRGSRQIDNNLYLVSAFATDAAIADLRTRPGVTVTILQDNAAFDAHQAQVRADIAAAEGPPVA